MRKTLWQCGKRTAVIADRPLVMGVLNVTPDSFSDGGRYAEHGRAVARGLEMIGAGADIVDVGGESTRPGSSPVTEQEEMARVVPVIEALRARSDCLLSIDTMKAAVARRALEAGADIVNDVSAFSHDAAMAQVAACGGAGVVLMHMRGAPRTMQNDPRYGDVVKDVCAYLAERRDAAIAAGVNRAAIALDPGIGFGKTVEHNLRLLAGIGALVELGCPVLVGLSRKRFIGELTGRDVDDRLSGTLAGLALCAWQGAHILRVHDVREACDTVAVAAAIGKFAHGRADEQSVLE